VIIKQCKCGAFVPAGEWKRHREMHRPTAAARGYDNEHRRRRRALLPHAYGTACALCGLAMLPGQALDLDHTTPLAHDRSSKGDRIVHAACNRARRG
jgi:hypothetical protein